MHSLLKSGFSFCSQWVKNKKSFTFLALILISPDALLILSWSFGHKIHFPSLAASVDLREREAAKKVNESDVIQSSPIQLLFLLLVMF